MERSTFCSFSNDGKYSSTSLNIKSKMIVLRKSFSKEENENYIKLPKINKKSAEAVGLLGLGGYLIGSSGKKATEKRIEDRLRHIDYKIDPTYVTVTIKKKVSGTKTIRPNVSKRRVR